MFGKNNLLKFCGVILIAISMGGLLSGNRVNAQNAIATLSNGNYQFCSQPKPDDWRSGAGVCFNFVKTGDRVDGYYGYPHTDDLICVRGEVKGSLVTGEALAMSWGGSQWISIPNTEFKKPFKNCNLRPPSPPILGGTIFKSPRIGGFRGLDI